jgi:hypothetical protein
VITDDSFTKSRLACPWLCCLLICISLAANTNAVAANVTIRANNVMSTVPPDAFGIFMAVWDTWGANTPAQLKQAGVTAMRYPGGGYADDYHWSSYLMTPFDGETGNDG